MPLDLSQLATEIMQYGGGALALFLGFLLLRSLDRNNVVTDKLIEVIKENAQVVKENAVASQSHSDQLERLTDEVRRSECKAKCEFMTSHPRTSGAYPVLPAH